ncbi:macrophage mannose receptor 1-like protein, partial [Aphelenchoides avenae]
RFCRLSAGSGVGASSAKKRAACQLRYTTLKRTSGCQSLRATSTFESTSSTSGSSIWMSTTRGIGSTAVTSSSTPGTPESRTTQAGSRSVQ